MELLREFSSCENSLPLFSLSLSLTLLYRLSISCGGPATPPDQGSESEGPVDEGLRGQESSRGTVGGEGGLELGLEGGGVTCSFWTSWRLGQQRPVCHRRPTLLSYYQTPPTSSGSSGQASRSPGGDLQSLRHPVTVGPGADSVSPEGGREGGIDGSISAATRTFHQGWEHQGPPLTSDGFNQVPQDDDFPAAKVKTG